MSDYFLSVDLKVFYAKPVAFCPEISNDPRFSILKEIHALAKSEYDALEKCYNKWLIATSKNICSTLDAPSAPSCS